MSILVREARASRCAPASVREVCLLGIERGAPSAHWGAGERVTLEGRAYRVEATRPLPGEDGRYIHLTPEADTPRSLVNAGGSCGESRVR
jgi:hypothetical protein